MIRGLSRHMKEPSLAEMRTPVTLVKLKNVPDAADGFNTLLTKQFSSWSKMVAASGSSWGGSSDDSQSELTHVFIIRRHPGYAQPESSWYAVHNERLYKVLELQELGNRGFFWVIATNDEGALSKYRYDDTATEENPHDPDAPAAEPAHKHTAFPFWGA